MQPRHVSFFLLTACLIPGISACRKGNFSPEQYQSLLTVVSSPLSDQQLEVRFDGLSGDSLIKAGGMLKKEYLLNAWDTASGKETRISIYKAGTGQLVSDTSIYVAKNSSRTLKVIYSNALGVKGFLSNASVPRDSIKLQMRFTDNTSAKKYPKLQLLFNQYQAAAPNYNTADNINLQYTLDTMQLTPAFMIPTRNKSGDSSYLVVRFVDPVSGATLKKSSTVTIFPTSVRTAVGNDWYGGDYGIVTLTVLDGTSAAFIKCTTTYSKL